MAGKAVSPYGRVMFVPVSIRPEYKHALDCFAADECRGNRAAAVSFLIEAAGLLERYPMPPLESPPPASSPH